MLFAILLSVTTSSNVEGCDVCAQEKAEYCEIFPSAALCATKCGFEFDEEAKQCTSVLQKNMPVIANGDGAAAPIIGGSGKFRYQYMPNLLQAPAGATFVNCHGLAIDKVSVLSLLSLRILYIPSSLTTSSGACVACTATRQVRRLLSTLHVLLPALAAYPQMSVPCWCTYAFIFPVSGHIHF